MHVVAATNADAAAQADVSFQQFILLLPLFNI